MQRLARKSDCSKSEYVKQSSRMTFDRLIFVGWAYCFAFVTQPAAAYRDRIRPPTYRETHRPHIAPSASPGRILDARYEDVGPTWKARRGVSLPIAGLNGIPPSQYQRTIGRHTWHGQEICPSLAPTTLTESFACRSALDRMVPSVVPTTGPYNDGPSLTRVRCQRQTGRAKEADHAVSRGRV